MSQKLHCNHSVPVSVWLQIFPQHLSALLFSELALGALCCSVSVLVLTLHCFKLTLHRIVKTLHFSSHCRQNRAIVDNRQRCKFDSILTGNVLEATWKLLCIITCWKMLHRCCTVKYACVKSCLWQRTAWAHCHTLYSNKPSLLSIWMCTQVQMTSFSDGEHAQLQWMRWAGWRSSSRCLVWVFRVLRKHGLCVASSSEHHKASRK